MHSCSRGGGLPGGRVQAEGCARALLRVIVKIAYFGAALRYSTLRVPAVCYDQKLSASAHAQP